MPEPLSFFEQQVIVVGEGTPDRERALYPVSPGQSSSDQGTDRKPCIKKTVVVVGAVAGIALLVAIYAAVKK